MRISYSRSSTRICAGVGAATRFDGRSLCGGVTGFVRWRLSPVLVSRLHAKRNNRKTTRHMSSPCLLGAKLFTHRYSLVWPEVMNLRQLCDGIAHHQTGRLHDLARRALTRHDPCRPYEIFV